MKDEGSLAIKGGAAVLSLYFRLIGSRVRSQLQYKVSFWLQLVGFGLVTAMEFAVIAILVGRFGGVGGWSVAETALLYGLTSLAFSLAEMVARGFDAPFERMIQLGAFDGVLTRPLGSFFQILTADFQLRRLGRSLQALLVLAYALPQLAIAWSPDKLLLVPVTVLSGAAIYMALIVIGATLCFWTVRTPEVINVFTFGGEQMTSYPLSIYQDWLRTFFLFIVPVGFANYPAGLYLLGRTDPHGLPAWLAWCAPVAAAAFLTLALRFWRIGVSKYTSTGS
jgi:ABC-2 type transport system permease protein